MALRPLDGYPASNGAHVVAVFPHAGPTSYTQVTTGTQASGGDSVSGVECGIKYFDIVLNGTTDSGRFAIEAIAINASGSTGQQSKTYTLRWTSKVTALIGGKNQTAGSEAVAATNLSGETVRLFAIGNK
jgi:hypothetical protein